MIAGKNISYTYKGKKGSSEVLKRASFLLRKGRITTLMGQSGAGKTTLLKCVAGLNSEYDGQITYNEMDIKTLSAKERGAIIGFVSQRFHLFPHLTALKNCTYALLHVMGVGEKEAVERAMAYLELLQVSAWANSYPKELSGGQEQRVAISRALVLEPKILLLDEPTSALDPESKKSLETLLLDLHKRGLTLALSCHDMPFIRRIRDILYFMENGAIQQGEEADKRIEQFLTHN